MVIMFDINLRKMGNAIPLQSRGQGDGGQFDFIVLLPELRFRLRKLAQQAGLAVYIKIHQVLDCIVFSTQNSTFNNHTTGPHFSGKAFFDGLTEKGVRLEGYHSMRLVQVVCNIVAIVAADIKDGFHGWNVLLEKCGKS